MWWDKDVMLKGDVVQNLVEAFDVNWQTFVTERQANGNPTLGALWSLIMAAVGGGETPGADRPVIKQHLLDLEAAELKLDWQPAQLRFLHSRPRFKEDLIYTAYLDFINRAESEILLYNSYFVPEPDLIGALTAAARRGVKVRLMTNHEKTLDIVNLATISRTTYKSLLAANDNNASGGSLEIFEWGGQAVLGNGFGVNHAKYAVFDREAGLVGSYNMDPRSHYLNAEVATAFASKPAAQPLIDEFEKFTAPAYAVKVTKEQADEYAKPGNAGEALKVQFLAMFKNFL
jgi:phosphatidylserine/phosphatidylglycerophosphate/cardiolipin synthase-like enzyme